MARKKLASAASSSALESSDTQAVPAAEPVLTVDVVTEALEVVKVNNANVTELKIALDDAVKRVRLHVTSAFLGVS